MINHFFDLFTKTVHSLPFCTNSGSILSVSYLPQNEKRTTFLSDEHPTSLHSDIVPKIFREFQEKILRDYTRDFI